MKKPTPTQAESLFEFHEFFFSTTNERGVIRYGNDVFARVSVYPKEQMMGAPHSLIRHPDMPRAVFKVFWDFLKSDRAIGAYVKNLAGNGSYYWVYAFAFPIEGGYLSIRFKPSSPIFQTVQKIYEEVRAFERASEKGEESLEKSVQLLNEKILEHGFSNYQDFMIKATIAELNSRLQNLEKDSAQDTSSDSVELQKIGQATDLTLTRLQEIFGKVSAFQKSNEVLTSTIASLDEEFIKLKFISVNMTIAAAKFGNVAASLGVVSKEFSALSQQIESSLSGLRTFVQNLNDIIQRCSFRAAALNSQMLMVDFFVKESLAKIDSGTNAFTEMVESQKDFSELFRRYSRNLGEDVASLSKGLRDLDLALAEVPQFITGLEVVRQIGAVESARLDEVRAAFLHYLAEMDKFIQFLRSSTSNIFRESGSLKQNTLQVAKAVEEASGGVDTIFELASEINDNMKQVS